MPFFRPLGLSASLCASCVAANKIILAPVVFFLPARRDCFSPSPPEQIDRRMAKPKTFEALKGAPPSASVQRTQRRPPSPPSTSLAVIVSTRPRAAAFVSVVAVLGTTTLVRRPAEVTS